MLSEIQSQLPSRRGSTLIGVSMFKFYQACTCRLAPADSMLDSVRGHGCTWHCPSTQMLCKSAMGLSEIQKYIVRDSVCELQTCILGLGHEQDWLNPNSGQSCKVDSKRTSACHTVLGGFCWLFKCTHMQYRHCNIMVTANMMSSWLTVGEDPTANGNSPLSLFVSNHSVPNCMGTQLSSRYICIIPKTPS